MSFELELDRKGQGDREDVDDRFATASLCLNDNSFANVTGAAPFKVLLKGGEAASLATASSNKAAAEVQC